MLTQYIYVHYDTVSNHVLSKGIHNIAGENVVKRIPENLLLIDGTKRSGVYDNYTGFQIIRGSQEVQKYLNSSAGNPQRMGKWIDFASLEMLHLLTPIEISEILYIAHAHNHLHSPFYYKLQNNYIYLDMPNGFSKVYYRYLTDFHDKFAEALTIQMTRKLNEKKRVFQKPKTVADFPVALVNELIPVFKDGVTICFEKLIMNNGIYFIPLYITEDNIESLTSFFEEQYRAGYILYNEEKNEWKLQLEDF